VSPLFQLRLFSLLLLFSTLAWGSNRRHLLLWQAAATSQVEITVTDQNGQPLVAAQISIEQNGKQLARERTTPSGNAVARNLAGGAYKITVEKQGFYATVLDKLELAPGTRQAVEVKMQPVREYREEVEVMAQPSPIDPEQTTSSQAITAADISIIPYPTTRDYRNVLPYIPGVLADSAGQIHVAGSSTQEIQDYLDGFEVSQPAGGALSVRVNPDSLRKIDVQSSRYSPRFGKGSGGLTDLEIQDGDNHLRFNATDFIPTFQNVKGLHFNNWTPRAYFSGPLVKDKIWFNISHEGENDLNIIKQLPDGADQNTIWRTDDLARLRMNLTPSNVITFSALVNLFNSDNTGISAFDPVSVSTSAHSSLYVLTLKDQFTIARNTLLEFGGGYHRTKNATLPQGTGDYIFTPTGREGNFYFTSHNASSRAQAFSNLFLRPMNFLGTHQFTVGGRVDRIVFSGDNVRTPLDFVDQSNNLLRRTVFTNDGQFSLNTMEASGYVQDRWMPVQRVVVEPGVRWDHDSFLQRDFYSPRIAGSALLERAHETKFTGGIGVYYDRSNLSMVSQALQGIRTDTFFSPTPKVIPARFVVDPSLLTMPRFINWSVGLERRLPWDLYARVDYLNRHGTHVWAYEQQSDGSFLLQTHKEDRYDAEQITLRKELKRGYPAMVAYTHSKARSNESLDFNIDNFTTGTQQGGPLQWDAPNQVTSWGSYPLPSIWKFRKFDFSYSVLYRTGFPFITVNDFGQLVNGTGKFRFPAYLSFSPAIEKKFAFHGYLWAARVAIENITNNSNANVVDNNVNSPTFLTFFGQAHRTLNGRIRFLGKQ
jgi:hypothetical protein